MLPVVKRGPGRGILKVNHTDTENLASKRTKYNEVPRKARGGTLIICPMALLGQWKDELITHSKPESISVSVYYGGEKGNDPEVIAEHDVFLTTYGVLTATYKNKVCDAFEVAGRNVMSTSNNVTTELVSHKLSGLGDLGVQGIGISVGKLDLYVAAAGINAPGGCSSLVHEYFILLSR